MNIPKEAVEATHAAICEQNLEDCLEWRGRCVKAVEAAAPHMLAAALDGVVRAAEDLGLSALSLDALRARGRMAT